MSFLELNEFNKREHRGKIRLEEMVGLTQANQDYIISRLHATRVVKKSLYRQRWGNPTLNDSLEELERALM